MIALRKKAGLTQEAMADRLAPKTSNISRLESVSSRSRRDSRLSRITRACSVTKSKVEFARRT
jgi:hypothetical protein